MDRRTFLLASSRWLGAVTLAPRLGAATPGPYRSGAPDREPDRPRVRFVASDPRYVYSRPCFAPDGNRILFMRAPATDDPVAALNANASPWSLWAVSADGGDLTPIFSDPGLGATRPDWSPRSGRVAFTGIRDGRAELWVMDGDGGNLTHVPVGSPPRTSLFYPSWYPDGTSLGVTDYAVRRVLRVDLARGDAVSLTDATQVWAGMCSVSPDTGAGNPLAFAGQRPGSRFDLARNTIWTKRPEESARQLDRAPGRTPAWSPTGQRLAYSSSRRRPAPTFMLHRRTVSNTPGAIFVQRLGPYLASDGPPEAVTPFDHRALHPKWSPDGTRLTCMLDGIASGVRGIAVIDLER